MDNTLQFHIQREPENWVMRWSRAWMRSLIIILWTSILVLPHASSGQTNGYPAFLDSHFSPQWVAAVKSALAGQYPAQDAFNFPEATNLLCQASARGNPLAQGLWGFTLVVTSQTPETSSAGLKMLQNAAETGDPRLMVQLGTLYESGQFVPTNYSEAFHWYARAADLGNPDAELRVGSCYHYGMGTKTNWTMAAKYFSLAAAKTNYTAMKSLGFLLMNGFGVDKDEEGAKYWLTRAAYEGRNRRAMYDLGAIYTRKFPDTNALALAFKWYHQSALLEDPMACYQMACYYYQGWGVVATNHDSYRYWLLQAARHGSTEAQYEMGTICRTGDGDLPDLDNALKWYHKAAAKNDPRAFYDLALYYRADKTNATSLKMADDYMRRAAAGGHREAQFQCAMSCFRGQVAPINDTGGRDWLAQSAENGWPKAEYCLFELYFHGMAPGSGCQPYQKDVQEGVKWLRRAADHGFPQAQSMLGVMLIQGKEVEPDKTAAEKLLRSAAEHGYAQGQNDLGYALLHGDFISADPVEPAVWLTLAKDHAPDANTLRRAEINLSQAFSRLDLDQTLEVDRRAKAFQPLIIASVDPMVAGWQDRHPYSPEDGIFEH